MSPCTGASRNLLEPPPLCRPSRPALIQQRDQAVANSICGYVDRPRGLAWTASSTPRMASITASGISIGRWWPLVGIFVYRASEARATAVLQASCTRRTDLRFAPSTPPAVNTWIGTRGRSGQSQRTRVSDERIPAPSALAVRSPTAHCPGAFSVCSRRDRYAGGAFTGQSWPKSQRRPAFAWLLAFVLPGQDAETIIGDLEEEYASRSRSRFGAGRWYWAQLVRSLPCSFGCPSSAAAGNPPLESLSPRVRCRRYVENRERR